MSYEESARLDRVIRLVWRSRDLPGSILYNLYRVRESLQEIEVSTPKHTNLPLRRKISRMISRVEKFPIEDVFPARMSHLDLGTRAELVHAETLKKVCAELVWLRSGLQSIHGLIEDYYFSHQNTRG